MAKVIVSNNSALLRHLMGPSFRHLDIDVSVASTGDEAVATAARARPDLAILDAEMPGISGYSAGQQIKATLPGCKVVLVLGTRISPTQMQRVTETGCDEILIAPMGADELYDVVAIQLGLPRRGIEQFHVDVFLVAIDGNRPLQCQVTNLSVDGARLVVPDPLTEGTRLHLTVTPESRNRDSNEPLSIDARVTWLQTSDAGAAVGVSFQHLDEDTRARLARLTQWEIIEDRDRLRVVIKGDITEMTRFSDLLALMVGRVDFDMSQVRYINSLGVREWVLFLKRADIQGYEFHACSIAFTLQAAMIPDMVGCGTITSFFAPYCCDACGYQTEKLLQSAAVKAASCEPPVYTCAKCGDHLQLDDIPERYLAFLDPNR